MTAKGDQVLPFCGRRRRNMVGWNVTMKAGLIAGYLCPACQTPAENAEAEINESTLIYTRDTQGATSATAVADFMSIPGADPGTCAGCHRVTDTGLATVGEAEWHLAFAKVLGIAQGDADTALRQGDRDADDRLTSTPRAAASWCADPGGYPDGRRTPRR